MINQIHNTQWEEREFYGIFALFPFSKPAGDRGKNGNNTYRVIPYSPRRFAEAV